MVVVIPRKRIDIGWPDLARGVGAVFSIGGRKPAQEGLEHAWCAVRHNLACLSVRSGFDALLAALAFPAGSEVVLSAVNIRDMARIIEAHGLVAVPVDIDMRRLAVAASAVERALTPRTRAVLVAHLFGSRMPVDEITRLARERGLVLVEDCAQVFTGDAWRGHRDSDACLFSFGPIKTATALAGGIASFRDAGLRERVGAVQERWPVYSRWRYLMRILKYAGFVLLGRRTLYGAFAALCRACGTDVERVLASSVRGFAGGDFFSKIRCQPPYPLLALLRHRIEHYDTAGVARRIALAARARELMPRLPVLGSEASNHSCWVFPARHGDADRLMRHLVKRGFDATRGASSLDVVGAPPGREEPAQARQAMGEVLYLPVHEGMDMSDVDRLAKAVAEFDTLSEAGRRVTPLKA
jgi:dTDP-4-amino-4,6-dideoxygalactose transaminase